MPHQRPARREALGSGRGRAKAQASNLRILGIDPGTEATGYGAIDSDGERHRLLDYGVLATSSSLRFSEKLLYIHSELLKVIDRCRPDRLAVESVFYAANVKSALKLGHVRGVALLAGVARGLPIDEYSPLEIKQAVVGYGRADKQQVQKMVALLLDLDRLPEPYDAADALAAALCHAHRARFSQKVALAEPGASSSKPRRRSGGKVRR